MNALIAFVLFFALLFLCIKFVPSVFIGYSINNNQIVVKLFRVIPIVTIAFRNITHCIFVPASTLWIPWRSPALQSIWLHNRMFVDGLVIKCGTVGYVVTPVDPLGVKDSIELHKLDDLEKH